MLLAVCSLAVAVRAGAPTYRPVPAGMAVARVVPPAAAPVHDELEVLLELHGDVWSRGVLAADGSGRRALDVMLNETGMQALRKGGWEHQVIISDVRKLVETERARIRNATSSRFAAEYHPLDEIHRQLEALAVAHGAQFIPSIATSHEGRTIPVIRFGGSRAPSADKKTFWIQGGIHAREWISPATVMEIVERLLTSSDPEVRRIVEELEFAVAPVVNPDGYHYTWTNSRLWRKNRRPDGLCSGVDLNRNWAEHWGECGASTNPCSDTYRGPSAMSEPESAGVGNFVVEHIDNVAAAIDFHAYGQIILRPYGWALPREAVPETDAATGALAELVRLSILSVHGQRYTSEHAAELYCASGGADDWFFANASRRAVAGGFCIELRDTGRHGFVLPADQIEPTADENMAAVLEIARYVAAQAA